MSRRARVLAALAVILALACHLHAGPVLLATFTAAAAAGTAVVVRRFWLRPGLAFRMTGASYG